MVVGEGVDWVGHVLVDDHGHAFLAVADLPAVDPDGFGVIDLGALAGGLGWGERGLPSR